MCVRGRLDLVAILEKFVGLLKTLFGKKGRWLDFSGAGGVVLEFRTLGPMFAILARDWFNVAWANHRSWACGILRLFDSEDPSCKVAALAFHNHALRFAADDAVRAALDLFTAMGVGNSAMQFTGFDFTKPIVLRIHEIVGGDRLAPVFKPAEVEVKCVGEELAFWKGMHVEVLAGCRCRCRLRRRSGCRARRW